MRPRQWLKNVLVFAAPLAAGQLLAPDVLLPSIGAFIAFCLISSATYLVNDARDVALDREHPTKRHRSIAAGQLSAGVALGAAVVLALASLALAFAIRPQLAGVVARSSIRDRDCACELAKLWHTQYMFRFPCTA